MDKEQYDKYKLDYPDSYDDEGCGPCSEKDAIIEMHELTIAEQEAIIEDLQNKLDKLKPEPKVSYRPGTGFINV